MSSTTVNCCRVGIEYIHSIYRHMRSRAPPSGKSPHSNVQSQSLDVMTHTDIKCTSICPSTFNSRHGISITQSTPYRESKCAVCYDVAIIIVSLAFVVTLTFFSWPWNSSTWFHLNLENHRIRELHGEQVCKIWPAPGLRVLLNPSYLNFIQWPLLLTPDICIQ